MEYSINLGEFRELGLFIDDQELAEAEGLLEEKVRRRLEQAEHILAEKRRRRIELLLNKELRWQKEGF